MTSVHRPALEGASIFVCAQAGCPECLGRLLRQHRGLVRWVIRRDCRGDLSYDELFHEGQIALWQAILHFDPTRHIRFSTYAVPAIRHRLWHVVAVAQRPQGYQVATGVADPAEAAEATWQRRALVPSGKPCEALPAPTPGTGNRVPVRGPFGWPGGGVGSAR